jgi:membrane associated rhomboid family serine protease
LSPQKLVKPTYRASHLWFNLVVQLIFGVLLETVHHWKRVATVYVAGVVGGSLAITIFTPDLYGLGASAGVYAILTAHLAVIIMVTDLIIFMKSTILHR